MPFSPLSFTHENFQERENLMLKYYSMTGEFLAHSSVFQNDMAYVGMTYQIILY